MTKFTEISLYFEKYKEITRNTKNCTEFCISTTVMLNNTLVLTRRGTELFSSWFARPLTQKPQKFYREVNKINIMFIWCRFRICKNLWWPCDCRLCSNSQIPTNGILEKIKSHNSVHIYVHNMTNNLNSLSIFLRKSRF